MMRATVRSFSLASTADSAASGMRWPPLALVPSRPTFAGFNQLRKPKRQKLAASAIRSARGRKPLPPDFGEPARFGDLRLCWGLGILSALRDPVAHARFVFSDRPPRIEAHDIAPKAFD